MSSFSTTKTTIFCLHYLGGSAREWSGVAAVLDHSLHLVPIDLPGFGTAAMHPGFSVESMALFVAEAIAREKPERWMLAGHSMGAKVATVMASWQRDGRLGIDGLVGLILLAGSPPSPEPMSDDKRSRMSNWFQGDEGTSLVEATGYVADNVGAPLDAAREQLAVTDVLACNRAAWLAWLQQGSKEDWQDRVGLLAIPTLIVTGSSDQGLGREAQRKHTAPHFTDLEMVDLPGAGHLLPLERAERIAQLVAMHAAKCQSKPVRTEDPKQRYRDLMLSDRVGEGTREALLARIEWKPSDDHKALSRKQLELLDHMLDRVIPQNEVKIDLAGRLDAQLASGGGDGWRFATLPVDRAAYQRGLDTLETVAKQMFGTGFVNLETSQQQDLLARVANGTLIVTAPESGASLLDAAQMTKWFDDVRADATRLYMSHPDTLARIGYSGIANGGDGQPKSGFIRVRLGEREAWEPNTEVLPS